MSTTLLLSHDYKVPPDDSPISSTVWSPAPSVLSDAAPPRSASPTVSGHNYISRSASPTVSPPAALAGSVSPTRLQLLSSAADADHATGAQLVRRPRLGYGPRVDGSDAGEWESCITPLSRLSPQPSPRGSDQDRASAYRLTPEAPSAYQATP